MGRKGNLGWGLSVLLVGTLVTVSGCASLKESVEKLASKEKYGEALRRLEKVGVGATIALDAKPKHLEARSTYEALVTAHYRDLVAAKVRKGNAREALRLALAGHELCVWSDELVQTRATRRKVVDTIEQRTEEWAQLSRNSPSLTQIREYLLGVETVRREVSDSAQAKAAFGEARNRLVQHWGRKLPRQIRQRSDEAVVQLEADLMLTALRASTVSDIVKASQNLILLPWRENDIASLGDDLSDNQFDAVQVALTTLTSRARRGTEQSPPLYGALKRSFEEWLDGPLTALLSKAAPSFNLINTAESVVAASGVDTSARFIDAMAHAHLKRAAEHSTAGRAASLSLLHLARCKKLSETVHSAHGKSVDNKARASFVAGEPIRHTIAIDVTPEIDPQLGLFAHVALRSTISSRTVSHCRWQWVNPIQDTPLVAIRITSIELSVASLSDLPLQSSRYWSHFEDAPNPEKARLKGQLDVAEFDATAKKSAYDSARRSHNSYPTQWSLQNANIAYIRW